LGHDMRTWDEGPSVMICPAKSGKGFSVFYYTNELVERIGDF
jgi:hypothetical protein